MHFKSLAPVPPHLAKAHSAGQKHVLDLWSTPPKNSPVLAMVAAKVDTVPSASRPKEAAPTIELEAFAVIVDLGTVVVRAEADGTRSPGGGGIFRI